MRPSELRVRVRIAGVDVVLDGGLLRLAHRHACQHDKNTHQLHRQTPHTQFLQVACTTVSDEARAASKLFTLTRPSWSVSPLSSAGRCRSPGRAPDTHRFPAAASCRRCPMAPKN